MVVQASGADEHADHVRAERAAAQEGQQRAERRAVGVGWTHERQPCVRTPSTRSQSRIANHALRIHPNASVRKYTRSQLNVFIALGTTFSVSVSGSCAPLDMWCFVYGCNLTQLNTANAGGLRPKHTFARLVKR